MNKPKAVFCWSGGKDSSYCLHKVLTEGLFDVKYLLTTINDNVKRISMHGVREELLDNQVASIGIPLLKVKVRKNTNEEYEELMRDVLLKVKTEGINNVIFGDIFLEDLKKYREGNLSKIGMNGVFPLWKIDTSSIVNDLIAKQFKTVICCVDDKHLGKEYLGKEIDSSFIKQLPVTVDPCGENGEFHTFCYDGPLFKNKIGFTLGEKIYKQFRENGFWYCDLVPNK
jgi:uncharacterized protein (TIGR00290 family)